MSYEPRDLFFLFPHRFDSPLPFPSRNEKSEPADWHLDTTQQLTVYAAGYADPPSSSPAPAELGGTAAAGDVAVVAAPADEEDGFFLCLSWGLRERLCGVAAARTWSDRPRGLPRGGSEAARGLA